MFNMFQGNYGQNPYMRTVPNFVAKQVTNIEEAKASMIDPLATYLFVDTSTGKIYLKRLNNNGLADFFIYSPEEPIIQKEINPIDEIKDRLANIEKMLGGKDVQSVSNDECSKKSTTINA